MNRWRILWAAIGLLALLLACGDSQTPEASRESKPLPPSEGRIVAMGDSLTEGLGLEESDAYPAQLQRRLRADGYNFDVINAGVSGETSSGALSRVDWVLTLDPDIVILETGANDGLRGIDPELTRRNIDQILRKLRNEDVIVILAGMKMVRNLGQRFTTAFDSIYPQLAKSYDVALIPFFLDGVAGRARLNTDDGIHPNAEGYARVVETIYPFVVDAVKEWEKDRD